MIDWTAFWVGIGCIIWMPGIELLRDGDNGEPSVAEQLLAALGKRFRQLLRDMWVSPEERERIHRRAMLRNREKPPSEPVE